MKTLNKVQLLGNLGQDPEVRNTSSNKKIATLNIATTNNYKDQSGEWQESTDWHRVIVWEKLAEVCEKYLKKGSKVFIEGKLRTRSYEKDGTTHYVTEVLGNNLIMLSGAKSENKEFDSDVPF